MNRLNALLCDTLMIVDVVHMRSLIDWPEP